MDQKNELVIILYLTCNAFVHVVLVLIIFLLKWFHLLAIFFYYYSFFCLCSFMVRCLEPFGPSSRKIRKIFEGKIDKEGINWKSVYGENKDFYYEEFTA